MVGVIRETVIDYHNRLFAVDKKLYRVTARSVEFLRQEHVFDVFGVLGE